MHHTSTSSNIVYRMITVILGNQAAQSNCKKPFAITQLDLHKFGLFPLPMMFIVLLMIPIADS